METIMDRSVGKGAVGMDDRDFLAQRFDAERTRLAAVAYRMLGSTAEADDAVQEAWIRLDRTDTSGIGNLSGWLTTVVARVCLDMLRSRKSRRQDPLADDATDTTVDDDDSVDPEQQLVLADSVGLAMLVVLETLTPAERVAFVLHDMFAVPFDEVGEIVGRSTEATRQLASRARRRVQGAATTSDADVARRREVVGAFLAASRHGDFDALLAVLDPDVEARADAFAVRGGATTDVHGARALAEVYMRRARFVRMALVDGRIGLVAAPQGTVRIVFDLTLRDGLVAEFLLIADPEAIATMDIVLLDDAA
jgi:RNA polymerase sigma-70 factor (ECF subfamily)